MACNIPPFSDLDFLCPEHPPVFDFDIQGALKSIEHKQQHSILEVGSSTISIFHEIRFSLKVGQVLKLSKHGEDVTLQLVEP